MTNPVLLHPFAPWNYKYASKYQPFWVIQTFCDKILVYPFWISHEEKQEKVTQTYRIQQFCFVHALTPKKLRTATVSLKIVLSRRAMIEPWFCLLPFAVKGRVGGRGEREKERWGGVGAVEQPAEGAAMWDGSGCYFLALAALAEFRGGVTGRPEPRPPPPPYGYSFLSAGFKIWKEHMSVSSTLIMAPALSNSPQ